MAEGFGVRKGAFESPLTCIKFNYLYYDSIGNLYHYYNDSWTRFFISDATIADNICRYMCEKYPDIFQNTFDMSYGDIPPSWVTGNKAVDARGRFNNAKTLIIEFPDTFLEYVNRVIKKSPDAVDIALIINSIFARQLKDKKFLEFMHLLTDMLTFDDFRRISLEFRKYTLKRLIDLTLKEKKYQMLLTIYVCADQKIKTHMQEIFLVDRPEYSSIYDYVSADLEKTNIDLFVYLRRRQIKERLLLRYKKIYYTMINRNLFHFL